MSRLAKIGNQVIDVNEPVRMGIFLGRLNSLDAQLDGLLRRLSRAGQQFMHLEEAHGKLRGRVDEQDRLILALERTVEQLKSRIYELETRDKK